jgi:hypothetical protein
MTYWIGIKTSRQYRPAKIKEERDKDNYNKYICRGSA